MRTLQTVRANNQNVVRHPFDIPSVFGDFGSVFDALANGTSLARPSNLFAPAFELVENETAYLLSFDLPGVPKDDIQVEVKENQLRVTGERKGEEKNRFYSERRYGRFERVFTLPADIDVDKIEAQHQDGVLQLTLAKAAKAQPRSIKIG